MSPVLVTDRPRVSVIVPCRNEASHIATLLHGILAQEPLEGGVEVIIADGFSDDGTREILQEWSGRHPQLRVIDNPGRIVSTGLNEAIRAARGEVIVRMDAHTDYAPDYLRRCLEVLSQTGADNVGGPWQAEGRTYLQRAIAVAFQSPFSSGGAASHSVGFEGPADSVYLGCWRKETLERLGGFDEELVRNQDDELNLRITRAGGKVWQSPLIQSRYTPRASLAALFRQYAQYGYWKVRVIQKHKLPASLRHLVPGAFVGLLILSTLLAPWHHHLTWAWLAVIGMYAGANLAATLLTCRRAGRIRFLPVMPLVFAGFHLGYGYGFLRGMIDFLLLRRGPAGRFTTLTRSGPTPKAAADGASRPN